MEHVPSTYRPLWEAKQEEWNGNASYGTKNSRAYAREFGEEYDGDFAGEIGAAELTN